MLCAGPHSRKITPPCEVGATCLSQIVTAVGLIVISIHVMCCWEPGEGRRETGGTVRRKAEPGRRRSRIRQTIRMRVTGMDRKRVAAYHFSPQEKRKAASPFLGAPRSSIWISSSSQKSCSLKSSILVFPFSHPCLGRMRKRKRDFQKE